MIYLDNGATSFPKPQQVRRAVLKAMDTCANPGRGGYEQALEAAKTVYHCREEAAELFGEREDISLLSRYLLDHLDLLEGCGQCFSHGDYNPGNLILQPDGSLGVIDFNAYNGGYGEPVFETAVILSDSRLPEEFRTGFCTGYFGQDVPQQLLDYYLGYGLLAEFCESDEEEQERLLVRIGDFCKKIR